MSILFDPRDARCKSPFGAVTTFAAVDFTFYPRGHAVTGCTLLAHHEFSDRWTETELLPTTDEDGTPAFSGTFFALAAGADLVPLPPALGGRRRELLWQGRLPKLG